MRALKLFARLFNELNRFFVVNEFIKKMNKKHIEKFFSMCFLFIKIKHRNKNKLEILNSYIKNILNIAKIKLNFSELIIKIKNL